MLNTRPAFHFSWSRVAAAFGVFLFLRMFWPQSVLWTKRLWDEQGHLDKHVLFAMIITLVLLFPLLMFLLSNNTVYLQSEGGFAFYRELAHALAEGHTEIGLKVSPELLAMEDPYDPVARLEQEVPFYLDYAFYHGKYYVYFGVIPCLLFYLPLYALFGVDVPGWLVLVSLVWLIVLGNALLLLNMAKRYRPDLSQAVFGLLWVAGTAVYSLPSVLGDACNYYIPAAIRDRIRSLWSAVLFPGCGKGGEYEGSRYTAGSRFVPDGFYGRRQTADGAGRGGFSSGYISAAFQKCGGSQKTGMGADRLLCAAVSADGGRIDAV